MKNRKIANNIKKFVRLAQSEKDETLFDEEWHREQYEDELENDREKLYEVEEIEQEDLDDPLQLIDRYLQREDYNSIAENAELHEIAIDYSDAYKIWSRLNQLEGLPVEDQKAFLDQVDFFKETLNLSEEKAIEKAIAGIRATAHEIETEDAKNSFIEEFRSYEELGTNVSSYYKALAKTITNENDKEAELLVRSFWNYTPPSVIRERFNIGVRVQSLADVFAEAKVGFEEEWSILTRLKRLEVEEEEQDVFKEALSKIEDLYEKTTSLIKKVFKEYTTKGFSEKVLARDIEMRQSFLEEVAVIEEQVQILKESVPRNSSYAGTFLSGLNDLISRLLLVKEVLIEPKGRKVLAGDFTDWHNQVEHRNKAFDQFFALILSYTSLLCSYHLKNPSIANLEGVDGDLESLRNAVLYGIGFQDTGTKTEKSFSSSAYDEFDYERLANDRAYYEETIAEIHNPLKKQHVIKQVENARKWSTAINRESSVLAKIHDYLANTKSQSEAVCPACHSSRWSYEAIEANSSSTFFKQKVLPLILESREVAKEKIDKPIQGDLLNDWRFNPFKAPGGMYAKGEGKYCGGLFNEDDADEVRFVLERFASEGKIAHKELQEELNQQVEKGLLSSDFIEKIKTKTPFKIVSKKDGDEEVLILEQDLEKIVQISWPEVSASEAKKNAESMQSFLEKSDEELYQIKNRLDNNEEITGLSDFTYRRKIYTLTRPQFSELEREFGDKICFHAISRKTKSLAHLIQQTVKGAIKGLKYISTPREQEQGLEWTCPACGHLNKNTYIDLHTYDILKEHNSDFDLECEFCGTSSSTSDINYRAPTQKKRQRPLQSLQFSFDDESGTLEDVLEGTTLRTVSKEESELKTLKEQRLGKIQKLIDIANNYGNNKTYAIKPSSAKIMHMRPIEMQFTNLGDAFRNVFEVENFEELFKTQNQKLLPVAYKLGLIFPFAACLDCGTIHPSIVKDTVPNCIHIEKIKITSTNSMNEIALAYKKYLEENPTFPKVHEPNFGDWKERWNKTAKAAVQKMKRIAQIDDDDDFDLGALDQYLSEKVPEKQKEEEEGELFKGLEDVETPIDTLTDTPTEGGLFEGLFEEETEEETEKESITDSIEDPIQEEESSEEEFEEADLFEIDEVKPANANKPFEIATFSEALSILDSAEKKKILGSNMKNYSIGDSVEQIPSEILTALKTKLGTDTIKYIVESPLQIVQQIFEDLKIFLRRNRHVIMEEDEDEELFD